MVPVRHVVLLELELGILIYDDGSVEHATINRKQIERLLRDGVVIEEGLVLCSWILFLFVLEE